MSAMTEAELQALYQWVDDIPLSRPKRNIGRDFADGVLVAEIVRHYFPKLVEIHNYSAAHSVDQKLYNWRTLNRKVFRKLSFEVDDVDVKDIVNVVPGAIERFLRALQTKVTQIQQRKRALLADGGGQQQQQQQQQLVPPLGGLRGGTPRGAVAATPNNNNNNNNYYYNTENNNNNNNMMGAPPPMMMAADTAAGQLLHEKEETIQSLRETIAILNDKVRKLEDILRIKDNKIQALQEKVSGGGGRRMM
eukprot:PhM_4_TR15654/c6_g1_i1/m.61328